MAMNTGVMTYDAHLEHVKNLCLEDGMTEAEWHAKLIQTNITLRSLGFKGGADVRRIALKNGIFV